MNYYLWHEVACFKKATKGKTVKRVRDRVRVYVNATGHVKAKSERTGKEYDFNSVEEMHTKINALQKISYVLESGELPTAIPTTLPNEL